MFCSEFQDKIEEQKRIFMDEFVNFEKLEILQKQGKLSPEEFAEQKQILFKRAMRESGEHANPKSGVIYILLAWFLGTIGIHNFYAGYAGRAVIQLLLTLSAPLFLFVPLIVTALWAFLELLFQNTSRGGRKFSGSRKVIWMLRIGAVAWFVAALASAVFVDFNLPVELPEEDIIPESF